MPCRSALAAVSSPRHTPLRLAAKESSWNRTAWTLPPSTIMDLLRLIGFSFSPGRAVAAPGLSRAGLVGVGPLPQPVDVGVDVRLGDVGSGAHFDRCQFAAGEQPVKACAPD